MMRDETGWSKFWTKLRIKRSMTSRSVSDAFDHQLNHPKPSWQANLNDNESEKIAPDFSYRFHNVQIVLKSGLLTVVMSSNKIAATRITYGAIHRQRIQIYCRFENGEIAKNPLESSSLSCRRSVMGGCNY